jgi:HSP20 family protein
MAGSLRVHGHVERLFEGGFGWHRLLARLERRFSFRPRVEVLQEDDVHVLLFDVPGVRKDDLEIRVDDHHLLTVSGERSAESDRRRRGALGRYSERRYGSFIRTIELPRDADGARLTSELHDGVLVIRVPRLEASRGRVFRIGDRESARSASAQQPNHATS